MKELTEIVLLLDRSGSMSGLEADTIGGFNGLIEKQKSLPGRALVTAVLFDHRVEVLYDRLPLEQVKPMTREDYYVRGSTALLDAVGSTITRIRTMQNRLPESERPGKTLFVITTDGMENASVDYSRREVRRLIEAAGTDWEFLFLGANMDAVEVGGGMGIRPDHAVTYRCDPEGTALNYEVLNDAVCCARTCSAPLTADWKARIDENLRQKTHK